ncbi:trans-sialidase, partial [Trypanosoma conorhini]
GAHYKSVSSFYSHSLLEVNGVLVALAVGTHGNGDSNQLPGIWAKYNAYGANEKLNEDAALEGKAWETQLVTKRPEAEGYLVSPFGPKAVGKNNKIHLLLQKRTGATPSSLQSDPGWGLALIVGEVQGSTGERGEQRVSWGEPRLLDSMLAAQMQQPWERLGPASMSRGVAVGAATVLFPLAGFTTDGTNTIACTVMRSEDNGDSWRLPAAPVVAEDCNSATLLEWEGKLFMATSGSSPWRRRVFESGDEGKTWNEAAGPFARLLGDAHALPLLDPSAALMTATIAGRSVLLYTTVMSVHSVGGKRHHVLHLCLSDGARTHDVGPISTAAEAGHAPFSSLLYTRDDLFALYAKKGPVERSDILVVARLPQQLQRIKSVLQTWKNVDAKVAKLCSSAATPAAKGAAEPAAACVGAMPTDGLVGFLSNNGNNTHWNDEYLGVGATVSGEAKKVANGFALAGRVASIVWPVGRDGRGPGHGSAGEEVTLVATVTINEAPPTATPLLSVRTAETGMYLGLWYDEQRRWRTKFRAEADAQRMTWEEGRAYRVVLTVENGTGSAYVDGQLVGSLEEKPPFAGFVALSESEFGPEETLLGRRSPERVSHILVGKYRDREVNAEVHVTVKNVLLYNRCFNASEVAALERKEKEEASVTAPEEVPLRTAAPAASDPKNSAHDKAAATGGVAEEPSVAAGTGPATTDAAVSSAGDASVTRGAPAPGLNNASAALAKEAAATVQREAGGGDGTARGRVSAVLSLLLLALWGLSALC